MRESEQQRFVPGAGDLEERLALLAERDLAVVEVAGDEGQAVVGERLLHRNLEGQRRLLHHLQIGHLRGAWSAYGP